jgi:hypothetical protein
VSFRRPPASAQVRLASAFRPALRRAVGLAVSLTVAFAGCATGQKAYAGIDRAVGSSDFDKAVETLDAAQSSKKPVYPKKNEVLLRLDRGILAHYRRDFEGSAKDLGQAEKLIEDAVTKSLSAGIASYILNDNTKDYAGEDYENIYLNVFNALNYYHLGSLDDALVEARRTNEKLRVLADTYAAINRRMTENYRASLEGLSVPPAKPVSFSNSALADYLGALFYRADGLYDDARVNLLQLRNAFITSPNVYRNAIPAALVLKGAEGGESAEELRPPADANAARVNVVCFTGLSPVKVEEDIPFILPFEYGLDFAHLRLPALRNREDAVTAIELAVEGREPVRLELLEDIGLAIRETYNARYGAVLMKTVIRTAVKYASVYALAEAAARSSGSRNAGALTALAAKVAFDASERADTRMSRYLPAKAWVGAVNLPPGRYTAAIAYYSGGKRIASETRVLSAERGKLNLIEGVCLK